MARLAARMRRLWRWFPRTWRRSTRAWRHSLRFRIVLITTVSTTAAILVAIVWAALAIQTDLFNARRDEVLADTNRAVEFTQEGLNAADPATDRAAIQTLTNTMRENLVTSSSTNLIVGFPIEDQSTADAPAAFRTRNDLFDASMISSGLREQVVAQPSTQWWQSIGLPGDGGREVPAIVVGQTLEMPNVGVFEIYLAYSMTDVAQTLAFVQITLWITAGALVIIVAAVMWLVMRSVSIPIIDVAKTSARFAAGDMTARLAVQGEDELATLARSFNGMADSIEAQIRELAELSLVQQRFVSDVSHELRTPLTTIRLAAGILHGEKASFAPVPARSAELLHDQVGRFEELLNDLLEISRYDAGSVQLERESTSLSEIAADVVEQMRDLSERNGSELRLRASDGDDIVEVDPRRIRRILRNLIGNAIEHGEGEPIEVSVAADASAVAVGVRDYGLGMKPEDAARVFDRFWRADPSRQRTIGGTGLGLSIALGDAKLHGGSLEVWSQPGVGSHFVLTLPRGSRPLGTHPIAVDPPPALDVSDQPVRSGPATDTLIVAREKPDEEDAS
ncbi:MtrAB system histidine kinase MtrB [Microbacterium indicum]|uniref:MtrAB system histidine kinase MtrB n=1 Tax=Microbacterium indicum TaxID=358100 RepID=UPI0003FD6718|nr:MtrAB system histidine kinase MtrB [Microbacterium indicum]